MGIATATLVLHPRGRSAITFNTLSASVADAYYVPAETLEFNEDEREEIVYSSGSGVDGGDVIMSFGPLVDVEFTAYCLGSTKAQAMERARTLRLAINNERGGTLQYQPENISARYTYYHYRKSPIPALRNVEQNTWDSPRKHTQADGQVYVVAVDVVLRTLPFATSDPENLIPLSLSRSTLDNTRNGANYNYFDIAGGNIVGDVPASIRLGVNNAQTADDEKIARLYLTTRSAYYSTLANVVQIYEAEGAAVVSQSEHWSSTADASRSGSAYLICNPPIDANDQEQILRFTISNEADQRGRIAIMACVEARGGNYQSWDVKARYRAASDIVAETSLQKLETWGTWHLVYCGELSFPPTELDDSETINPTIDLVLIRGSSGVINNSIAVDFIGLIFLDETAAQFDIDDGMDENERFLFGVSPSGNPIAHVVNDSTGALNRAVDRHYGSRYLTARPGMDTRVFLLWERVFSRETIISDNFGSHVARYWALVANFEEDEGWQYNINQAYPDTTNFVEGERGLRIVDSTDAGSTVATLTFSTIRDLDADGRFTDDSYLVARVYVGDSSNLDSITIDLFSGQSVNNYFTYTWNSGFSTGWNYLLAKKSNFSTGSGLPSWSNIQIIRLGVTATGDTVAVTFDYLTVEKDDPDNSVVPNATGAYWDFQPNGGQWSITRDNPIGAYTLACLDQTASVEKTAIHATTPPNGVRGYAKVSSKNDAGKAGVVFRVNDQTAGSEDLYAFVIDFDDDQVEALKYTAGSAANMAEEVSQAVESDTWYYLGFQAQGSQIELFFTETAPTATTYSNKLAQVCAMGNRVFDITDITLSSGDVGVMSIGTLARFDDFYVENAGDRHVPDDQVTVTASALMRTIYPFPD